MWPVQVERGKLIQVRGGAVRHEALIGVEYGSKVCSPVACIEYGSLLSLLSLSGCIR